MMWFCWWWFWPDDATKSIQLVFPTDLPLVAEFLFVLLSQVQVVRLTEAERIGNRRSLQTGLPGLACRACCQNQRLGLCRLFPARRRTLPSKLGDLYDHLRRCSVTSPAIRDHLKRLKQDVTEDSENEKPLPGNSKSVNRPSKCNRTASVCLLMNPLQGEETRLRTPLLSKKNDDPSNEYLGFVLGNEKAR
jgi:hypothetical protein